MKKILAFAAGILLLTCVSVWAQDRASNENSNPKKAAVMTPAELKKVMSGGKRAIFIGSCWVKGTKEKKSEHFTAASLDEGYGMRLAGQRCVGRLDPDSVVDAMAEDNDCECAKSETKTSCESFQRKCSRMKVPLVACEDAGELCPVETSKINKMRDANSNGGSAKANNAPLMPRDATHVKVKKPVQNAIPGSNGYTGDEDGRLTPAMEELQNAEGK